MPFTDKRKEIVSDIFPAERRPLFKLPRAPQPLPPEPPSHRKRIRVITISTILFAGLLFYGTRAFVVKSIANGSIELIKIRAEQAKEALIALDTSGAADAFTDIKRIVGDIHAEASRFGLLNLAEIASIVYPPAEEAPRALDTLDRLSDRVLSLISTSEILKSEAFSLITNGNGAQLISYLTDLHRDVSALGDILEEMRTSASTLGYSVGDDVLDFRAKMYQSKVLLEATIEWLSGVNHLALMFVNPSEIRPGGGFPGSYATVTLSKGNLGAIEVRDIYDPDGQLVTKVIPPKQLQLITSRWGARDANWFFDFPTSARKTLSFLNDSKIYSEQGLELDAMLAINVNVVVDILKVTGPIELPEYHLTLTAANFLDEVQREVRSGTDRTTGDPKRILKTLTPILFERLSGLDDAQKKELIGYIRARFAAKDMMAYIDDPVMQAYLEQLEIAGEVEQNQDSQLNEYLAVVNANIGGGKSDAVMSQNITLKSRVDLEGRINNSLTIKRTHAGKASSPAWYNTTNKDFIQIFTPRGSEAVEVRGQDAAPAITRPDVTGYRTDTDVAAIEKSTKQIGLLDINQAIAFNKTVFSGWLNTAPGTTRTLELQYTNQQTLNPRSLATYSFVFEKQSGVDTQLTFTVEAPPEYKWKENNSATYTYTTKSAPGRLKIDLTLTPIR